MEIHLPDHPKIASKANADGFATVEEYVRHLVEEDAGPLEQTQPDVEQLSQADWQRRFEHLLSSVEPANPNIDDSRESIYPVR